MAKQTIDEITSEMIVEHLRAHLNEQRPVTLYNTFQGVPIAYAAEVAMIHPDYIGLIVHPYQAVCIKHERRTYIESKSLPTLIRAYPVSIDYTNQVVMLKRLKIPKSISTDLFHSWVEPEKLVKVKTSSEEGEGFEAELIAIAVLDHNRIRVVMSVSESVPYNRYESVRLAFRLAGGEEPVHVKGAIHSLAKIRNRDQKRMEVEGKADMEDEISILAYVARREDEVLAALDKAYHKLRKVKKRPQK